MNILKDGADFVTSVTDTVAAAFKFFSLGKKYKLLKEVCKANNITFYEPGSFSKTRMTNYKAYLILRFIKDFKGINLALDVIVSENVDGNKDQRELAAEAGQLKSRICNQKFLYELTGKHFMQL